MLISLRKKQNVNYMQRINSEMLISGAKRLKCVFHVNVWRQWCSFHQESSEMLISSECLSTEVFISAVKCYYGSMWMWQLNSQGRWPIKRADRLTDWLFCETYRSPYVCMSADPRSSKQCKSCQFGMKYKPPGSQIYVRMDWYLLAIIRETLCVDRLKKILVEKRQQNMMAIHARKGLYTFRARNMAVIENIDYVWSI